MFVLLAPKWGRAWYEGGGGGIGCIIQKGRGEGCQLLLHVGHSIHRATTVTTIIFVAQEGKFFWRFTNPGMGRWADNFAKKEISWKKDILPSGTEREADEKFYLNIVSFEWLESKSSFA